MTKPLLQNSSNLTAHQQEIFNAITSLIDEKVGGVLKSYDIRDYMISLTGAAGTGKTFLTVEIVKYLIKKYPPEKTSGFVKYNFTVTAPTHKAVSVIAEMLNSQDIQASCKTIHSFLGIKPFVDYEKGVESFKPDKTKKDKERTEILIVDESSMIGEELFEYIMEAIEEERAQVVLFVGDPYQLLPINKGENPIFKLPQSFELKEVVRQAEGSAIIQLATQLRKCIESQRYLPLKELIYDYAADEFTYFHNEREFMEDFYKNEKWYEEDKIIATHKNKDVDAFNRHIRNTYWKQKGINEPQTLIPGDQLRFNNPYSVNDITLYHNGQIVEIQSAAMKYHESLDIYFWECRAYGPTFRVVDPASMQKFNEKLDRIAKEAKQAPFPKRKELWKAFYRVRDMFADVQYVHASTIHKLQGSTYDITYVDLFSLINNRYLSDDDKYRLVYVAITRARNEVKLFLPMLEDETIFGIDAIDMERNFKEIDELLKKINI